MTYSLDTRDGYLRRMIAVGQRMGIAPRGIVIGIATALVESNVKVYANPKVPESMLLPHDAVGMDGRSVGIMQQQIVATERGWWWGTAEQCMNPETSFIMFFERLAKRDYMAGDAGAHAQAVQGSAYPDRYGQRMAEAQQLYDQLSGEATTMPDYGITKRVHGYREDTPADATGNSNGPRSRTDFVVIHTEEGNSTAVGLAEYCNRNGVSYNLIVDDDETVENVPVGEAPWAAADANGIGVHICFAGSRAAWTRSQWLAHSRALDRAAKAVAAACQQYRIPVAKIRGGAGWSGVRGIAAHGDFGQRGGGHTDPGVFLWDDFIERVKRAATTPTPDEEIDMAMAADLEKKIDALDRKLNLILDQIGPKLPDWGPQSSFGLDAQGRERTMRDGLIAALADLRKAVSK